MVKSLAIAFLVLISSLRATEVWDTHELSWTAANSYANPFRDQTLTVTFVHTGTGSRVIVRGFFDGNGQGGQNGNRWKVRFQPDLAGTWTWSTTTTQSDAGLNGQSGSFSVNAASGDNHGPLVPAPPPYLHMPYADGTFAYQIGLWVIPWQHSASDRQAIYDLCEQNGINRFYAFVVDQDGLDKFLSGDYWRYNLAFMTRIDEAIREALAEGIHIDLALYRNNTESGLSQAQDQQFFLYAMARFGAFRNVQLTVSNQTDWHYGGYCSTAGNLNSSNSWADQLGQLLAANNPHGTILTTHNPGECYRTDRYIYYMPALDDWPFASWTDFIQKQIQMTALSATDDFSVQEPQSSVLNERGFEQTNTLLHDLRATYSQAVCLEEYGFEYETVARPSWQALTPTGVRKCQWLLAASGSFGTNSLVGCNNEHSAADVSKLVSRNTVAYFGIIADTMRNLPFWDMEQDNSIVSPLPRTIGGKSWRSTFAIAKPGEAYLVYLVNGGSGTVQLAPGQYHATILNPRNGTRTDAGLVAGGSFPFSLPSLTPANHNDGDGSDWVLLFESPRVTAGVQNLGGGCGVPPEFTSTLPVLGQDLTFTVTSAPAFQSAFVLAGLMPPSLSGGCFLFTDWSAMVLLGLGRTDGAGDWSVTFPLLSDPQYAGLEFLAQMAFPGASGIETSNGLSLLVGY